MFHSRTRLSGYQAMIDERHSDDDHNPVAFRDYKSEEAKAWTETFQDDDEEDDE